MRSIATVWLMLAVAAASINADTFDPSQPADNPPTTHTDTTAEAGEEAEDGEKAAHSDVDDPETLRVYDQVEVRERADNLVGIAVSATEGTTGRLDLARRPILRAGELLETTPGVVATQHSGGGKANQYFVRGFNLDHGTDFSIQVAGVPVNMPTHGHGQGYADLSFLIPEVVERCALSQGSLLCGCRRFFRRRLGGHGYCRSITRGASHCHRRRLRLRSRAVGRELRAGRRRSGDGGRGLSRGRPVDPGAGL